MKKTKRLLGPALLVLLTLSLGTLYGQRPRGKRSKVQAPKTATSATAGSDSTQAKTFLPASLALVTGRVSYVRNPHFRQLGSKYSVPSRQIYLQRIVADQFEAMSEAAAQEGITLRALSGTRTFEQQKGIWERKWSTRKGAPEERARDILLYSSMPMTSRHHWGTDIDINNLENSYFATGRGKAEYEWLCRHGHEYGFAQVFTEKTSGRPGYELEKWHWSYLPAAEVYLQYYHDHIGEQDITGFTGSETAGPLRVIADYVGGVETPRARALFPWSKK